MERALDEAKKTCPDCGVRPNNYHSLNCDVARCGSCGGQLYSCDCENPTNTIWEGTYPGYTTKRN